MKKIYGLMLAFAIEWHWWFIMRYRRRGNYLLENGEALNSPEILALSQKITWHGMRAFRYQSEYEAKVLS